MARLTNTNLMVLAIMGIFLLSAATNVVVGQCQGDIAGLIDQCAQYVQKNTTQVDPSPACCEAVRSVDVLCWCQNIPPEFLQFIDMDKVAYVAKFCGNPLPPGTKCGGSNAPSMN